MYGRITGLFLALAATTAQAEETFQFYFGHENKMTAPQITDNPEKKFANYYPVELSKPRNNFLLLNTEKEGSYVLRVIVQRDDVEGIDSRQNDGVVFYFPNHHAGEDAKFCLHIPRNSSPLLTRSLIGDQLSMDIEVTFEEARAVNDAQCVAVQRRDKKLAL